MQILLLKRKINDIDTLIHKIPKKFPMIILISLLVLSISAVGLPSPNAWASSYNDFDDDDRTVSDETFESEAFSDEPNHPERRTITGNNDGFIIDGTSHNDVIIGTEDNDDISAEEGNDVINSATGADTIEGNDGDETIAEADGSGQVYGNSGNDVISGGFEPDYLSGGSGDDELYGGEDDDTLRGGSGKDFFDCGFGFDIILDFDPSKGETYSTDCEVIYEK
jgi:RTX calcium-binding nonapeptide repeat (4 copies)